jgi:hypothetical protein
VRAKPYKSQNEKSNNVRKARKKRSKSPAHSAYSQGNGHPRPATGGNESLTRGNRDISTLRAEHLLSSLGPNATCPSNATKWQLFTTRAISLLWMDVSAAILVLVLCSGCGVSAKRPTRGGMDNVNSESNVLGHWVHSHEEDSGNLMVFRPSTYPFPPSRGRSEYRLDANGILQSVRPGPTDKRESCGGTWSLEDGVLVLRPAGGQPLRLPIVSVDSERLVVKKP